MIPFRLIVAGSRDFDNYSLLQSVLDFQLQNKKETNEIIIISGGARGADRLGEKYAHFMGFGLKIFPADWNKYGKSAGYIRNADMGSYGDALVAFWDTKSKGTRHMISCMIKNKKPIRVYDFINLRYISDDEISNLV